MGAHFRFIHCADLHIGARFREVAKVDPGKAEAMTRSVFESFSRIVDLGIEEGVDAMFIAGDAFDETTITPSTRMFLVNELRRFGKPAFMVKGNHDPVTNWEDSIPFPDNVTVFGTDVETHPIPGVDGAEAVGVSFRGWQEERNLPSMMSGSSDRFTVACVHCDVGGNDKDYSYSPCMPSDLVGKGVDYWALGHIHKRGVISESPYAIYSGNIQGRSFKETGEKGAYLVTVRDSRVIEARFVPTQGFIWYDESVDITGMGTLDELIQRVRLTISSGSLVRLTMVGRGSLDRILRERRPDVMRLISEGTGCTVTDIDITSTPDVDLDSLVGSRDMVGTVVTVGRGIEDMGRTEILSIISGNPVMKAHMKFFNDMDEDELRALVREATVSLVSKMGVTE